MRETSSYRSMSAVSLMFCVIFDGLTFDANLDYKRGRGE